MICERMITRDATGRLRALHVICSEDADMPCESSVYKWLIQHAEFAQKYARAREILAEINANEIINIADNDGDPQMARVRIDARKWWASKVAPKKYGDKVALTDADDGTLTIRIVT